MTKRTNRPLLVLLILTGTSAVRAGDFVVKDEAEFAKLVPKDAKVEKLAGGMMFLEGPVWTDDDGGYLVFSDIPADEMKKWTAKDGVSTFRHPSHQANGNTRDGQGRLVTCEHASRSVTRTDKDGKVETLADRCGGKKLNSPNDVVVKSDGAVYFTDPPYGLKDRTLVEQPGNYVYRIDPKTGDVKPVVTSMKWPNGLCFTPDEKKLYVGNSDGKDALVNVFDVKEDGTLGDGKLFCRIDKGAPDGIRCDADGRLWSTAGDGVYVFSTAGELIGKILTPEIDDPKKPGEKKRETPANCCFGGGEDGKSLFMTAGTSLYRIKVSMTGAKPPRP